jgi:alpha-tubulin suppressor-like RCC1 family protein
MIQEAVENYCYGGATMFNKPLKCLIILSMFASLLVSYSNNALATEHDFFFINEWDNSYNEAYTPIKIITTQNNSFVIDESSSLWGWGYNRNGIIKNTSQESYSSPTWLLDDVKNVSAGSGFVYALKNDNSLWVWGSNYYGALGFGDNEAVLEPSLLMSNVKDIAVGHSTAMILTNLGELYVVGYNGTGLLGKGYISYSPSFDIELLRTDIKSIYSSAWNFFAIDNQNNLYGWGSNGEKVIYNETSDYATIPKLLLADVERLSTSGTHVLVKKTNGELWGWGDNKYGQLANLPLNHIAEPTFISNDVRLFAAGFGHSIITNIENQLFIWGADLYYNFTEDQDGYDKFRVGSEYLMDNIINIGASSNHSLALSSEGKLYTWGSAEFGGMSGNGSSYSSAESAYPREIADFSTTGFEPWFYLKSDYEKMNIGSFLNIRAYDKWMEIDMEVYWAVDNEIIASISDDGLLSAHAPGIINIIATRKDDSSKSVIMSIEILEISDFNSPVLSNFQMSEDNAIPGQFIKFSIDIDDFETGPKNGTLKIYDPGMRNQKEIFLVYDSELGILTGNFEVTSQSFNGEWKLSHITGFDQVGNESNYYFDSEFFTVSGGEDPDFNPPVLSNFRMSKTSVVPGDMINFSIDIRDNQSGPKYGYLTFQGPEVNENHFVSLDYNSTTGKLEGAFEIFDYMSNGVYILERLFGFDNQDNQTFIDLSMLQFDLSGGTEPDLTPPSLTNLWISQDKGKEGDVIYISIDVEDSSPVSTYGYITLLGQREIDVVTIWLNYNEISGKLEGTLTIDQSMPNGLWIFESVNAYDSAGNEAVLILDLVTLLIEGNFDLDTTPPVITVTPYSTEPTHLPVTVSVTTNEGTLNASSHTFNENGSFTFIATDLAGNVTEKTVTITHIVSPTQVKTISISQLPFKLNYIQGVDLDPTGGQISVITYEGSLSTLPLTLDMLSGYDPYSSVYGPQTVTVTYQGVTTTFEVYLNRFIDVPYGHRNYIHINALVDLGIINGYSDNTFRPNNTLTRAQAAIMIVRAAGLSTEGVSSSFTDVPPSHAAYKFISAAYQIGIINGYSDGTFRPNANVTRAQIAIMVQRAFNVQASETIITFTDVPEGYAPKKFIETLASQKIVNGYSDGTFKPLNNVTRAQFSTMIYNAIQYAQKTE